MTNDIKSISIKNGVLSSIILSAITIYVLYFDLQLITNVWVGALKAILITTIFGIISVVMTKKKLGGLITFKEAFTSFFITKIVSFVIATVFLIVLFKFFVTPEVIASIKTIQTDFNIKIMKLMDRTQPEIDEAIKASQAIDPANVVGIIKSEFKFILLDILIGFLVALTFKNKDSYSIEDINPDNTKN